MDDLVLAALKKWPSVPACYGWLGLDARGDWYLRDARTQHAGRFPQVKGSRIDHALLKGFIERNYAATPEGEWFFQNGPQCVFVELEASPWIWRVQAATYDGGAPAGWSVATHTGLPAQVAGCWLDEHDRLYLHTDRGLGLVHTLDMGPAADAIEAGAWPTPQSLTARDLQSRFGVVLSPADAHGGASM